MIWTQHRRRLRQVAVLISLPWFLYWGHSAYVSIKARDAAEAAWFKADRERNWTAAYAYEEERREAAQNLVRAVAWGFFLPLAILVAAEVDAGIRRVKKQGGK